MTDSGTIARRWFEEVWNQRREETINELLANDAVGHMAHGKIVGPEPFRAFWREMIALFPDTMIDVEDIVQAGENAVVRWRLHGTASGKGFGIDCTGHTVACSGITWMRIRDGRVVEGWDAWNSTGTFALARGELPLL